MSGADRHLTKRPRKMRKLKATVAFGVLLVALAAAIVGVALGASPWLLLLPLVVGLFAHRVLWRPGAVPVFTFHSVSDDSAWLPWAADISLSSELFDRLLALLAATGCRVISTAELVDARREGRPLAPRSVVLHLDDGYLDNWVAATPLLKKHGMPATVFVSTDFITPGDELRPTLDDGGDSLQWDGYLNAAEMRAMMDTGLVEIEAHGTDHGRIPVGPASIGELTRDNWRNLAWAQWSAVPGDKSAWYQEDEPTAVPLGSPVPENGPTLTCRRWRDGNRETLEEFAVRVQNELARCRRELGDRLGRPPRVFCWPQNRTTPRARELALAAGFTATTGGWRENRPDEDPTLISRIHVGKNVLGVPCLAADVFYFRAQVGVGLGNYYWYPVLMLGQAVRKLINDIKGAPQKSQP